MTDQFDRAAELEALHREAAIARQAERSQQQAPSAYECEECGETIPESRREAAPGCRCCIECQQEMEKYGKTRFTARVH